jgi:hypothetical protein
MRIKHSALALWDWPKKKKMQFLIWSDGKGRDMKGFGKTFQSRAHAKLAPSKSTSRYTPNRYAPCPQEIHCRRQ